MVVAHEPLVSRHAVPDWSLATSETTRLAEVIFHIPHAFTNTTLLHFRDRREDGEYQLRNPVSRHVSANVHQVQMDTPLCQLLHNDQRIGR